MYYVFVHLAKNKLKLTQTDFSLGTKIIPGRGGEEKFILSPPHHISWRRHCRLRMVEGNSTMDSRSKRFSVVT